MTARRLSIALVCAALVVGCKTPGPVGPGLAETSVKGRKDTVGQLNLTTREIRLRDRDGRLLNGVAVQIGGKTFLVRNGVVSLDDEIMAAAKAAGKLVVSGAGFLPMTLLIRDDAPSEIVMTATEGLGRPGLVGAGGGTIAAAGDKALVMIPADFLTGGTPTAITVGTYRPVLAEDAQLAFDREFAALLAYKEKLSVAGGGSPGTGTITPGGPVTGALGVSLTVDGPVKGGQVMVTLDLAKQNATPAEIESAKRITEAFAAYDASGDPTWRQALREVYGITLDGTLLTFPVKLGDAGAVDGLASVEVDGLSVLGTRLEVTVITANPSANTGALAQAVPVLAGDVPTALLAARLPGYTAAPALKSDSGTVLPDNGPDAIFSTITNQGSRLVDTGAGGQIAALTAAQLLTNNAGALIDQATGNLLVVDGEARRGTSLIAAGQNGTLISNNAGGLMTGGNSGTLIANNTAGLIANNSGGLLSNNAGSFISNNSGGIITQNGAGIITQNGAGIITQNGAGIITQNGAGIVANNSSQLTGFPFFPFAPEGAKYQLLQLGVQVPRSVRETPTGLLEYLWPGRTRVRAIGSDGSPLTDWTITSGSGSFFLTLPTTMPIVFFLQCEIIPLDDDRLPRRAYALAFAPGKKQSSMVAVDASTNMVATSTLHLLEYIPPEHQRLSGLAQSYEEAAEDLGADVAPGTDPNQPPTGNQPAYKLHQATASEEEAQLAALQAALALIDARTGVLGGAWTAFNPFRYGSDLGSADRVVTKAQAQAACKATSLRAGYDPMYAVASSGGFRPASFQAINPDSPPLPPVDTFIQ